MSTSNLISTLRAPGQPARSLGKSALVPKLRHAIKNLSREQRARQQVHANHRWEKLHATPNLTPPAQQATD